MLTLSMVARAIDNDLHTEVEGVNKRDDDDDDASQPSGGDYNARLPHGGTRSFETPLRALSRI